MIGSRAVGLLSTISKNSRANRIFLQQVRNDSHAHGDPHGGWHYRTLKTPPRWSQIGATGCAVVCWWWFYWNLYHGWSHLVGMYGGEFLQNPRTYTDEELGIPPE